jgi:hypothetical protein
VVVIAAADVVLDAVTGDQDRVGVEKAVEDHRGHGSDPITLALGYYAATWRDVQQLRLSMSQRELDEATILSAKAMEERLGTTLSKMLRQHVLWPWLSQYPGLGGVHTARVIAKVRDPRRFPGQQCDLGHTTTPDHAIGDQCPLTDPDGVQCPGRMAAPRSGTGVRSLWHYCGLHVVNGQSPRKTKGQRADWDPIARTAILQPSGIADAIVRSRVPRYRDIYDATKARLISERGADLASVVDTSSGTALIEGSEVAESNGIDREHGLRPFQIDAIARKVAAKAFVGDLLIEWKRLVGNPPALDDEPGEPLP